jgi:hypothetical protein
MAQILRRTRCRCTRCEGTTDVVRRLGLEVDRQIEIRCQHANQVRRFLADLVSGSDLARLGDDRTPVGPGRQ